jgi:RNA polymerase sigma factor (sigma-70 family)
MPTGRASLLPSLRRAVLARDAADRTDADLLGAFARDRDGDAFAELVRRHGPMVLGVCRRLAGDWATADDAFQAVFLVLARRAAAVRPRSAVGSWLYGVAYRTAAKARAVLARRRAREKQVDTMPEPPASTPPEDLWSDVRPVIDEELARLPERLRLPVVLCDLEGRPQRQVAKNLDLPPATLATRLASARRLLAGRLARRGVALSGGALASVLTGNASAAVSPRLADGLARAAEAVCAGSGVGSLVSAQAIQLSEGVVRMMLLAKLRTVGAAVLTALVLTTGLGVGLVPAYGADPKPGDEPRSGPAAAQPTPPVPVDDATFLRRACLDLRGTPPSEVEAGYFAADRDANKRRKVVDWLLTDETVKAFLAKKLGVAADRIHVITFVDAGTVEQHAAIADYGNTVAGDVLNLDVNRPATLVQGNIVINEAYADMARPVTGRVTAARGWVEVFTNAAAGQSPPLHSLFRTVRLNPPPVTVYPLVVDPGASDLRSITVWVADDKAQSAERIALTRWLTAAAPESDAEFLRKVIQSARGAAPSAVEEKYFTEDKDPKKREKLLDLLLKDPAVARKLGDDWKRKMLEAQPQGTLLDLEFKVEPQVWNVELQPYIFRNDMTPLIGVGRDSTILIWDPNQKPPGRLEKVVGELLGAKKTDEQVLDGVSLVVLGRLPTESEKRLTLATIGKAADRTAAWVEAARALSATEEAKKHAAELGKSAPPAKPPEKK